MTSAIQAETTFLFSRVSSSLGLLFHQARHRIVGEQPPILGIVAANRAVDDTFQYGTHACKTRLLGRHTAVGTGAQRIEHADVAVGVKSLHQGRLFIRLRRKGKLTRHGKVFPGASGHVSVG